MPRRNTVLLCRRPRPEQPTSGRALPVQKNMHANRLIEIIVGANLVGYCALAIHGGRVLGRGSSVDRRGNPWAYWSIVLIALGCGVAFLLGAVAWRE